MQKFYTLEMKDELNMENLIYQLESTYSASLSQLNAGFWKRKVLFFYMEINEPCEANKKLV